MHTLLLWAVWLRYRPVAKEEIHIILLTSETLTALDNILLWRQIAAEFASWLRVYKIVT
jgi:hypothetical protein